MKLTATDTHTIEEQYRVTTPKVWDFVRQYPFLYPLLIEAIAPIRAQFPDGLGHLRFRRNLASYDKQQLLTK